eukprot:6816471-Prymnesium_polylepis.2
MCAAPATDRNSAPCITGGSHSQPRHSEQQLPSKVSRAARGRRGAAAGADVGDAIARDGAILDGCIVGVEAAAAVAIAGAVEARAI